MCFRRSSSQHNHKIVPVTSRRYRLALLPQVGSDMQVSKPQIRRTGLSIQRVFRTRWRRERGESERMCTVVIDHIWHLRVAELVEQGQRHKGTKAERFAEAGEQIATVESRSLHWKWEETGHQCRYLRNSATLSLRAVEATSDCWTVVIP